MSFPLFLAKYRPSTRSRAHFAILVPNPSTPIIDLDLHTRQGKQFLCTVINVVGTPMSGYGLEIERNFDANGSRELTEVIPIGHVGPELVEEPATKAFKKEYVPTSGLEILASKVPPPGKSADFLAPVNDTTNRRCQEWTMEFIRYLVAHQHLEPQAIDIVQSHRDPADFGISLHPVGN